MQFTTVWSSVYWGPLKNRWHKFCLWRCSSYYILLSILMCGEACWTLMWKPCHTTHRKGSTLSKLYTKHHCWHVWYHAVCIWSKGERSSLYFRWWTWCWHSNIALRSILNEAFNIYLTTELNTGRYVHAFEGSKMPSDRSNDEHSRWKNNTQILVSNQRTW